MSDSDGHEIVIIRRKVDDEDEAHHGGVWKIAFADFMTAMMAFFLVMWLISANEKTRATIARYFNPIKLDEMTPNRQGLRDPKDVETKPAPDDNKTGSGQAPRPESNESVDKQSADAKPPASGADSKPQAADQTVKSKDSNSKPSEKAPARASVSAPVNQTSAVVTNNETNSEDSFRDPFAPSQEIASQPALSPTPALKPSTSPPRPDVSTVVSADSSIIANEPAPAAPNASQQSAAKTLNPSPPPLPSSSPTPSTQAEANQLRAVISGALKDNLSAQPGPGLEVRATKEGTLISLMDQASFEMFSVGSARPQAKVAVMMEKVAQILKSHPGKIVIRGHTDGRVYKSGTYDNWRLSADRADMARNMLISGGLDEKRVERIEGLADRQLKNPNDPEAAENRRIEILLEDAKP